MADDKKTNLPAVIENLPSTEVSRRDFLRGLSGTVAQGVLDTIPTGRLIDLVAGKGKIIADVPTVASSLANLVGAADELDAIVDDSPLIVNYDQPSITTEHYYLHKGKLYENTPKLPSRRALNNPNFIEDLADEVEGSSWEYLESWNEIAGPNYSDEQGMEEVEGWSYNIREAGDNYKKALQQLEMSIRNEYNIPKEFKGETPELNKGDALIDYIPPDMLSHIMTKIKKDFPEALQYPGMYSTIKDGKRVTKEYTKEEADKIRNKGEELIKKHLQNPLIDSLFYGSGPLPTRKIDPSTTKDTLKDITKMVGPEIIKRTLTKLAAPKAVEEPKPEAPKQVEGPSKSPVQMANIASALSRLKRATPLGAALYTMKPTELARDDDYGFEIPVDR